MRDIFAALHGVLSISVYVFYVMLMDIYVFCFFMYDGLFVTHSSLGYC